MNYEPNPKHKPIPTPGRRGSICPTSVDSPRLLADSVLHSRKRYATDGEFAFCGQCHDMARDLWHGYPVGWDEVPPTIVRKWIHEGVVQRRSIKRPRKRSR